MKRIARLALGVILTLALTLTAAAAAPEFFADQTTGAFTVEYDGGTAGEYYALVVVEGIDSTTISAGTIQYIDQVTADAQANVVFENILIKDEGAPCTVYLGGSDLSSAQLLGYFNIPSTYTVSGTVTSASSLPATVTMTDTADATNTVTVNTTNGTYTLEVVPGTYQFVVTKTSHLSYTQNSLAVSGNTTKNATLLGGDVSGDGMIDISDIQSAIGVYNQEIAGSAADITGDDIIDISDIQIIIKNYNKSNVVE